VGQAVSAISRKGSEVRERLASTINSRQTRFVSHINLASTGRAKKDEKAHFADSAQKPDRANSRSRLDFGEAGEGRAEFDACVSFLHRCCPSLLAQLFVKLGVAGNCSAFNLQCRRYLFCGVAAKQLAHFGKFPESLENLKPGDYVLVDTTGARELTPITQRLGYFYDPVQVVFRPLTIGRVEAVRQSEVGTELVISVPMIFGRQTMYQRVLVPMDAVQGKIVAILNPPSRRRWLP
jgi:hypothetical protein